VPPVANNIAFAGMINPSGGATWDNIGAANIDGEDFTKEQIQNDGTLGGRFTAVDGWTTQNGKLPGLFGKTVDMPEHLGGVGINEITQSQTLTAWCKEGMLHVSGLAAGELWSVYTMAGRLVGRHNLKAGSITIDVSHLPSGVYIIKGDGKTGKIVKN
jgi:hypothetical protein